MGGYLRAGAQRWPPSTTNEKGCSCRPDCTYSRTECGAILGAIAPSGDSLVVVSPGRTESDTVINSGSVVSVTSGGSAINTVINSGGILSVNAGGSATGINQSSGAAIVVNTSAGLVSGSRYDGQDFSIAAGKASSVLLENGGQLTVLSGHTVTDTHVSQDGLLLVFP